MECREGGKEGARGLKREREGRMYTKGQGR